MERGARVFQDRADRQTMTVKPHEAAAMKLLASDLPPVVGKQLITVRNLHLKRGKHELLSDVNFRVTPGER
ncbi:hypothetical protein PJH52_29905, partial [Mycobacterium kansasii]